jgi:2-iminobutanoate/2-iminopropanoate deaminase
MNAKMAMVLVSMAVSLVAGAADENSRYITSAPSGTGASLPFSEAVWSGNTLYVAGHLGLDPKTQQVPADAAQEAKLVLDAVKETLQRAGLTMDDMASVTVYCTDLKLYDTFNGVYKGYFHGNYPARAFIGVAQLVRSAHFEVQGIAVKGH